MPHNKKFFLVFILIVALTGLLFINQIRRALSIVIEKNSAPLVSDQAYEIPLDPKDPILGNPGAALTLIEFADLTSKRGRAIHGILAKFVLEHPQDVRLVWKHFPAQGIFSRNNDLIHQAALCAGEQHTFWAYIDAVLALNETPDIPALNSLAETVKLDVARWSDCATGEGSKARVAADTVLAQSLGLSAPPGLFINNKRINLDKDVDLAQLLQTLIEK